MMVLLVGNNYMSRDCFAQYQGSSACLGNILPYFMKNMIPDMDSLGEAEK
jgi:hypothetical protein